MGSIGGFAMADGDAAAEHRGEVDDGALTWRVEGMDCGSCAAKVRTAVERLPGVAGVEVNLVAERLTLRRAAGGADPAEIERRIDGLGYRPTRLPRPGETPHGRGGNGDAHAGHSHAVHLHAHPEAEEAEERAGVPWWRTGKARLVAVLGALVARLHDRPAVGAAEALGVLPGLLSGLAP